MANKSTKKYLDLSGGNLIKLVVFLLLAAIVFGYNTFFVGKNFDLEGQIYFHFIDVDQGDAALIMTSEGNILIDTGPGDFSDRLISYLDSCGIQEIAYLMLTHPHEDHIGGADDVLAHCNVENVILPDADGDSAAFAKLMAAIEEENCAVHQGEAGVTFSLGDLTMELLAPNSKQYENTNDYSIISRVVYGNTAVMFTGDAEVLSEKEVLQKYDASALKSDLLKAGHHGSSTSTSDAFLAAVDPAIAVISCGKDNSYGHPHAETLSKLKKSEIAVCRTDTEGDLVFVSDGTSLVQTQVSSDLIGELMAWIEDCLKEYT